MKTLQKRKNRHLVSWQNYIWYDVSHPIDGDLKFYNLLGQYGRDETIPLEVEIDVADIALADGLSDDPTKLSLAAMEITETNENSKVQNYVERLNILCQKLHQSIPDYDTISESGPPHDPVYETVVKHDKDERIYGQATGKNIKESKQEAAKRAWEQLLCRMKESDDNCKVDNAKFYAALAEQLTHSFRVTASRLPFPVLFQLERALFAANCIRIRKPPENKDSWKQRKEKCRIGARKLILVYMKVVLPKLLSLHIEGKTLVELFADELAGPLQAIELAVERGKPVNFWDNEVDQALLRAGQSLANAELVCGVKASEMELHHNDDDLDFDIIQKRSLWPIAEYRCRIRIFSNNNSRVYQSARLEPSSFEIINKNVKKDQYIPPSTRRAIRENGWLVRDRFVMISSIKFDPAFDLHIADWLKSMPDVCGRFYNYLFDKGTGQPNVWLYSDPDHISPGYPSRDELLQSLGYFQDITKTKLGDRISLAFTVTKPVIKLSLDQIVAIPEIVRNGYTFTDGAGVYGMGIAKRIKEVFCLDNIPGAVQIRMGGVKGMLSLKVDFDENKIGIRPSMVKFRSNHTTLEVKSVARKIQDETTLFNQMLLILPHRNVPTRAFVDVQIQSFAKMAAEFDKDAQEHVDDINFCMDYVQNVIKNKIKKNGEPFTKEELEQIKSQMKNAQDKSRLPTKVMIMKAIPDEYGLLGENEVLVGDGSEIQGAVLIGRSPCNSKGDIQRPYAIALPESKRNEYKHLTDVLVMSTKGNRPLADMLSGGDYDGDEYHVCYEKRIYGTLSPVDAEDFGKTWNDEKPKLIDVLESFTVPENAEHLPISLCDQLEVFGKFMALGNIVSRTSDAWLRATDMRGPDHKDSLRMGQLNRIALDARKLSAQFTEKELNEIESVLNKYLTPDWNRKNAPKACISLSVLGMLSRKWQQWISNLDSNSEDEFEWTEKDTITELPYDNFCNFCYERANQKCSICEEIWFCSPDCKVKHNIKAGHKDFLDIECLLPSVIIQMEDEISLLSSPLGGSDKLERNKSSFVLEIMNKSTLSSFDKALRLLMDVIFGKARPLLDMTDDCESIDFKTITLDDLKIFVQMVLIEFACSFEKELQEEKKLIYISMQSIHPFDVIALSSSIHSRSELVVCIPHKGGDYCLVDKDGELSNLNEFEMAKLFRVSSLSGTIRILESLLCSPDCSSLMYHAMNRTMIVDPLRETNTCQLMPDQCTHLNASQSKLILSVTNPSFEKGFAMVQGPPGTGKTLTIAHMLIAIRAVGAVVTAPSNDAVANLALTLLSLNVFPFQDLVVWGENCSESVKFLNPLHRQKKYEHFRQSYFSTLETDEKKKKLDSFSEWLHLPPEKRNLADIEMLCDLDGQSLASCGFIFCTLNTAGSATLRRAAQGQFEFFVLDEAGQCPEAEFYIATSFPGVKKIIVVGDPKQLPATVISQTCEKVGYGKSFLANVLEHYPSKVHLLNIQYRMNPAILNFSNQTFYGGRIKSHESLQKREPHVKNPVQFINVTDMTEEAKDKTSWRNEFEAAVVKSIILNDEDITLVLEKHSNSRLIIISPYRGQTNYLKKAMKKVDRVLQQDIATIDSFQGQEGDIVVISTVRTSSAEFFNENRLNVALTRAKYVLRVVGDVSFFQSQRAAGSALANFTNYAVKQQLIIAPNIEQTWQRPDWTIVTNWEPLMTSKFHHCLKEMTRMERNVAFNTLLAVAKPDLRQLKNQPNESGNWQISSLKNAKFPVTIGWIPEEHTWTGGDLSRQHYVGKIVCHFAGTRKECLDFIQKNQDKAKSGCQIKKDLSGIITNHEVVGISRQLNLSWLVTNAIQSAIFEDELEELPDGLFQLDPDQERIITVTPPLLLESRSGTGKTNCLFCHALAYARSITILPGLSKKKICFVTVSPKLRQHLQQRYTEVQRIEEVKLPPVKFFSLQEFLNELISELDLDFNLSKLCTFTQYLANRSSHEKLRIDQNLVENEIGGCISGSLGAALKYVPLTKNEYLEEKRSNNIPNNTDEGIGERCLVYQEYEKYTAYKNDNNLKDVNDVVLQLIQELNLVTMENVDGVQRNEIYQSAYIDEVQDFSYASLFLICHVAGSKEGRWVACGDTAQMISPGCSFTFDGMKQCLRAIKPELTLKKVEHLRKNYRMSIDVLNVANAILKKLKEFFPHSIEYAPPEEAMKDLGLSVVLVDWEKAKKSKDLSFGVDQAVVFASPDGHISTFQTETSSHPIKDAVVSWIGDHPFILSSLESKGLEFEDVIVHAFNYPRSAWQISTRKIESLRLLRELYVAVTRAQQRVIILTKNDPAMLDFLNSLNCNLETAEPESILVEFKKDTAPALWFKRGSELFAEEKYELAANCFKASNDFAWSGRARGCFLLQSGRDEDARSVFMNSARIFFEDSKFKCCLDVMNNLAQIKPWRDNQNEILDAALKKEPDYLPREATVKFALFRGSWDAVKISDLMDSDIAPLFAVYRDERALKDLVKNCSIIERRFIERTLPNTVGDYYSELGIYDKAAPLFIKGRDYDSAGKSFEKIIVTKSEEDILRLAADCFVKTNCLSEIPSIYKKTHLLIVLLRCAQNKEPLDVSIKTQCFKLLGVSLVKKIILYRERSAEELYSFDKRVFQIEIKKLLVNQYKNTPIEIISWYLERKEKEDARMIAAEYLVDFTENDLLRTIVPILATSDETSSLLLLELERRSLLSETVKVCLRQETWNLEFAGKTSNHALSNNALAQNYGNDLRQIWRARRNNRSVRTWLSHNKNSPIALLLSLFSDPKSTGAQKGERCFLLFGEKLIRQAVEEGVSSETDKDFILQLFSSSLIALQIGDRVEIFGLQTAQDLNGKKGKVTTKILENNRYGVKINSVTKSVKVENLRLLERAGTPSAPSGPSTRNMFASVGASSTGSTSSTNSDEPPPLTERRDIPIVDDTPATYRSQMHNGSISSDETSRNSSDPGFDQFRERQQSYSNDGSSSSSSSVPGLMNQQRNTEGASISSDDMPGLENPNDNSSSSSDDSSDLPSLNQRGNDSDSEDSD